MCSTVNVQTVRLSMLGGRLSRVLSCVVSCFLITLLNDGINRQINNNIVYLDQGNGDLGNGGSHSHCNELLLVIWRCGQQQSNLAYKFYTFVAKL